MMPVKGLSELIFKWVDVINRGLLRAHIPILEQNHHGGKDFASFECLSHFWIIAPFHFLNFLNFFINQVWKAEVLCVCVNLWGEKNEIGMLEYDNILW